MTDILAPACCVAQRLATVSTKENAIASHCSDILCSTVGLLAYFVY